MCIVIVGFVLFGVFLEIEVLLIFFCGFMFNLFIVELFIEFFVIESDFCDLLFELII